MRKSTFRYLFVIAFAALAVQACAKKDTALTARAQTAKEKAAAEAKAAAEKAAGVTNTVATNLDSAPTRAKDCKNPIVMEAKETDLKIEDLITKEKGELALNKMTSFISVKSTKGATGLVHLEGSAADTPADLKELALTNKSFVVCHTVPKLEAKKDWSIPLAPVPNVINTEDGKTRAVRADLVSFQLDTIALQAKLTASSGSIEDWIKSLPNAKVIVTKAANGKDATVKIQFQTTNAESGTVMDQSYQLDFVKKDVAAAATEKTVETPVDAELEQQKHEAGVQ